MLLPKDELRAFPVYSPTAVKEDWAMIVKHVGTDQSGTVTVDDATGDMTFQIGVLGEEAVDATIDSGGDDDGVIDMSDANANTFGEVVDMINKSPNWVAVLGGVLRSDATANTSEILAETQAHIDGGIKIYKDTAVALTFGLSVTKETVDGGSNAGYQFAADSIRLNITNGASTALTLLCKIYSRNEQTGVETFIDQFVYTTATERVLDYNDWGGGKDGRMWALEGESLVVWITAGAGGTPTLTVPSLAVRAFYGMIGEGMLNAGHYKSDR